MNPKVPFSEGDNVDHPVSLYAATKKSNELMAHAYSNLYGIATTGLRFFTVYGPAGRPDMAPWLFTDAILNDRPIKVFNEGKMQRDFTYVDDIVEGILRIQDVIPTKNDNDAGNNPATSSAPYRIYNIGNNNPIQLATFIDAIEQACGKKAEKILLPMQKGDVPRTYADIDALEAATGHAPSVDIYLGIKKFVDWFQHYKQL
jgi:UDP-glucuronate 4-epimerase